MQASTDKHENIGPGPALLSERSLFRSAAHEEALARAHFLVDQRKLLGIFVGPSGTGRSSLLVELADELRREGLRVARLNLFGCTADELLLQLAAALGVNPIADASIGQLWHAISDALAAARFEQQHVVMLLDDVDRAQSDALSAIMRIAKCDPAAVGQQTLVLGCHAEREASLGHALLELATLRIELGAWSVAETTEFLSRQLQAADITTNDSTSAAAARLQELTAGVPRHVDQLVDLAIVAAQAQNAETIDASLIEAIAGQLAVAYV